MILDPRPSVEDDNVLDLRPEHVLGTPGNDRASIKVQSVYSTLAFSLAIGIFLFHSQYISTPWRYIRQHIDMPYNLKAAFNKFCFHFLYIKEIAIAFTNT